MIKLKMKDMKKELKENHRLWEYLKDLGYPEKEFKSVGADCDDVFDVLKTAKSEDPRLLLWVDAFYQTGRDVDWHFSEMPKGGPLEQLKINMDGNQDDGHLCDYLSGKLNFRRYIRDTYKWFHYLYENEEC